MGDQPIANKVIIISSKEESKTKKGDNTVVRITDQDQVKYVYFKKKADGTLSAVAAQFKTMDLDEGSVVRIGYVAEDYTDSKGFTRSSNKLINVMETNEVPVAGTPQKDSTGILGSSRAVSGGFEASITRQVAFKGAIELIRDGILPIAEIGKTTDEFERLLRRAALTNPFKDDAPAEDLPTIQVEESSGTPFDDIARDISY
jgi:hypothetical protein